MARSLNKAQLIGHLGRDPEVKKFSNGGSVVTLSIATTDQWKDRNTGERRERTEWHRVAIFSEPVGRVAQQYLRKGDQVFIEGRMETRKWTDQQGQDRYTTEVVVRPYQGEMTLLGGGRGPSAERGDSAQGYRHQEQQGGGPYGGAGRPQPRSRAPERGSAGYDEQGDAYRDPYARGGPPSGSSEYGGGGSFSRYPDDEIPF